jgi:hypothetical protein
MRPVTLNLDVLVRDPVNDNPWPGAAETIDFNDATCPAVDDEETSWLVTQVFVVLGYDSDQGDGSPAPAGWQVFSQEDAAPLIAQWLEDGLEFHAATMITCSNDPANFYVVSDSFFDVVNAFNTCCGVPNILTQALSLKISNSPLTAGVTYPCGTAAAFRWLAILGNNDEAPLEYLFRLQLMTADLSTTLNFDLETNPLTATTQLQKSWFEDFIGLVSTDNKTLVANSTENPGPDDVKVQTFDGGIARIIVQITDTNLSQVVASSDMEWALPGTQCGAGCESPYPAITTLPDATVGTPYNQTIQLQGAGPWQISVGNKPGWMTVSAPDVNGLVTLTGTPDAAIDDFEFIYWAANCGNPIEETVETQHTLILDIVQAFTLVSQPNPSALNFSDSLYIPFLDLFMAWSQSDDASGTRVMTSPDGVTWTLQNTGAFSGSLNEAAAGVDKVIIVGSGSSGLMTVDGINYTTITLPQAIQHFGIAYNPIEDIFVAVAQQGANRIFWTQDGTTWNTVTAPVLNNWSNITWSDTLGLLVAVASNGSGNQVMTSPDGIAWTIQSTPTPTRQWRKIRELDGQLYAISQDGTERLMYSPDAVVWTLVNFGQPLFSPTCIAYGNGLFLAAHSSGGTVVWMSSPTGVNSWISRGNTPSHQWLGMNFKQSLNRFVITGLGPGSGFRVATLDWLP